MLQKRKIQIADEKKKNTEVEGKSPILFV